MSLKLFDAIKGLRYSSLVFKFLFEDLYVQYNLLKLLFKDYSYAYALKKNLNCNLKTIRSHYKHMEHFHLEIFAHNGVFLNIQRINDIYPYITVIDHNIKSYENFELRLENTLCKSDLIELDIQKQYLDIDAKYNSISLQFVLETLSGGIDQIEDLLINLKNKLDDHKAVIFGTTVIKSGLKHKPKGLCYIKKQNESKNWFNNHYSLDDLYTIFERHFDNVTLFFEGSCLFFILQPVLKKLKLKPKLPKDDPLNIPFI